MRTESFRRNFLQSCRAMAGAVPLALAATAARADFTLTGDANSATSAVGDDDVITFTQSGTLTVTGSGTVDILLVGGGGGGGTPDTGNSRRAGGGGAGGLVYKRSFAVTGGEYAVIIGAGGAVDMNGGDTSLFGLTAYGGGHGAKYSTGPGGDGGSGGGGAQKWNTPCEGGKAVHASEDNIGHDGGTPAGNYVPGGGGGAGSSPTKRADTSGNEVVIGSAEDNTQWPQCGGDGMAINITGQSVYYAGGGAAFRVTYKSHGGLGGGGGFGTGESMTGTDGLGGGGAGGYAGGSGVAIIRYTPQFSDSVSFAISGDANAEELTLHDGNALVFRQNGSLTITGGGTLEILAVGGGGGGSATNSTGAVATGGGAGGLVHKKSVSVHAGTYSVVVGAGGAIGANGGDSSILGIVAYGGGAGAASGANNPGNPGGSGGGAAHAWGTDASTTMAGGAAAYVSSDNLGSAGGSSYSYYGPGGGGGAGSSPIYRDMDGETLVIGSESDNASYPQWGGDGVAIGITGASIYYAGGGAAFRSGYSRPSGGLGGGGGYNENGTDGLGGGGSGNHRGGSGVVIVRLRRSAPAAASEAATGGTLIRVGKGYRAHKFTANGTLTVPKSIVADVLLVGGGGGGGTPDTGNSRRAGGGGAGGLIYTNVVIAAGTYPVTIGAGGAVDENGGNTTAFGFTAFGGGHGAKYSTGPGGDGGSGGGGAQPWNTPCEGGKAVWAAYGNVGHDGGTPAGNYVPGGGGGAGSSPTKRADTSGNEVLIGSVEDNTQWPQCGGDGMSIDITGQPVHYAGGGAAFRVTYKSHGGLGGGGGFGTGETATGTDGLGGGGAGGYAGGSGVVIVRYRYEPGTVITIR